jgi:hypothetical protein
MKNSVRISPLILETSALHSPHHPAHHDHASFAYVNFDVISVRDALCCLRPSAAGPGGIPALFYKKLAYWLATPLRIVYQQSMQQASIPDEWRPAKVIPLYKSKGDKTLPSSYRPISLTSIACKVVERIVVNQLRAYLHDNHLIADEQHGFSPNRSTTTNLLQCDYAINQYLNCGQSCDLITLDFSRVFDKVSHAILSSKLLEVGVSGKLHSWLSDFLAHRSQYVAYKDAQSSSVSVISGSFRVQLLVRCSFPFSSMTSLVALSHANLGCTLTISNLLALHQISATVSALSLTLILFMHGLSRTSCHYASKNVNVCTLVRLIFSMYLRLMALLCRLSMSSPTSA